MEGKDSSLSATSFLCNMITVTCLKVNGWMKCIICNGVDLKPLPPLSSSDGCPQIETDSNVEHQFIQ